MDDKNGCHSHKREKGMVGPPLFFLSEGEGGTSGFK